MRFRLYVEEVLRDDITMANYMAMNECVIILASTGCLFEEVDAGEDSFDRNWCKGCGKPPNCG